MRNCVEFIQSRHGTAVEEALMRANPNRKKSSSKSNPTQALRQGVEAVDGVAAKMGFLTRPFDIKLKQALKDDSSGTGLFLTIENINLWKLLPYAIASSMVADMWKSESLSTDWSVLCLSPYRRLTCSHSYFANAAAKALVALTGSVFVQGLTTLP